MDQQVTIGKTISGKWGLFTGGFLAWPLQFEDVLFFHGNDAALHSYCQQRGFAWTGKWSSQIESTAAQKVGG